MYVFLFPYCYRKAIVRHKLMYSCSTFRNHSRDLNNEHDSYPILGVKEWDSLLQTVNSTYWTFGCLDVIFCVQFPRYGVIKHVTRLVPMSLCDLRSQSTYSHLSFMSWSMTSNKLVFVKYRYPQI